MNVRKKFIRLLGVSLLLASPLVLAACSETAPTQPSMVEVGPLPPPRGYVAAPPRKKVKTAKRRTAPRQGAVAQAPAHPPQRKRQLADASGASRAPAKAPAASATAKIIPLD